MMQKFCFIIFIGIFLTTIQFVSASSSCVGANKSFVCGDNVDENCTLNGNLQFSSDNGNACFTINKTGVVMDGAGYTINVSGVAYGIKINYDNATIKNFKFNISGMGVYGIGVNSWYNNVINNTFNSDSDFGRIGIEIKGSNNNFLNNTFNSCEDAYYYRGGGYVNNTHYNDNIYNGYVGYSFTEPGLAGAHDNLIYNANIYDMDNGNGTIGSCKGLWIFRASSKANNSFYNLNFTASNYCSPFNLWDTYYINTTYINYSNFIFTDAIGPNDGRAYHQWYLYSIYVNDTNGNPISGANISIYDKNNNLVFNGLTNSSGHIGQLILTEYYKNKTGTYYMTNYTINGTKDSKFGTKSFNLTSSTSIYLTLENIEPSYLYVVSVNSANSNPTEYTTTNTNTYFNVSTSNVTQLNDSSAVCTYSKSGEANRTSSSCIRTDINNTFATYNCSVIMQYYDAPGIWNVLCSVRNDIKNLYGENSTTFTYGSLTSLLLNVSSISFIDIYVGANNVMCNQPEKIINTGNVNISSFNITAFPLSGLSNPAITFSGNNFNVNVTTSPGIQLQDNTPVNLGVSLPKGPNSDINIYYFVSVPIGTYAQSYKTNATNAWLIEGIQ